MTPDELELAKEVSKEFVKQTLAPVQDIVREVSGPAATEVGLMLGDTVRVWRLKRAVRYLQEVKELVSNAGLELNPVAPNLLFPILDYASLQDDEDLHQRWIALLANAATHGDILPCFPDILRQLTSQEAQFLDKAYDEDIYDRERRFDEIQTSNPGLRVTPELAASLGISGKLLSSLDPAMIENLLRLMLVTRTKLSLSTDDKIKHTMPPANHLYVSELEKRFVNVCRIPKATSAATAEAGLPVR